MSFSMTDPVNPSSVGGVSTAELERMREELMASFSRELSQQSERIDTLAFNVDGK